MSSFSDGITAIMLKQADPEAHVVKDAMRGFVAAQQQDLIERRSATIESIMSKLTKAQESNAPQSVVDAYERLLTQATAS
jgi:tetrahydromethanopterin S-methyltransferase subunit B